MQNPNIRERQLCLAQEVQFFFYQSSAKNWLSGCDSAQWKTADTRGWVQEASISVSWTEISLPLVSAPLKMGSLSWNPVCAVSSSTLPGLCILKVIRARWPCVFFCFSASILSPYITFTPCSGDSGSGREWGWWCCWWWSLCMSRPFGMGTCRITLVKTKLIGTCILSLRSSVTAITEAQPQFESNFVIMSFSKLSQHLGPVSSACYWYPVHLFLCVLPFYFNEKMLINKTLFYVKYSSCLTCINESRLYNSLID